MKPVDSMTLMEVLNEVGPFTEMAKNDYAKERLDEFVDDLACNNATVMAAMAVKMVEMLATARMEAMGEEH